MVTKPEIFWFEPISSRGGLPASRGGLPGGLPELHIRVVPGDCWGVVGGLPGGCRWGLPGAVEKISPAALQSTQTPCVYGGILKNFLACGASRYTNTLYIRWDTQKISRLRRFKIHKPLVYTVGYSFFCRLQRLKIHKPFVYDCIQWDTQKISRLRRLKYTNPLYIIWWNTQNFPPAVLKNTQTPGVSLHSHDLLSVTATDINMN